MNCSDCFTDYLVKCTEEINVFAQLSPVTTYTWIITDKFDQKYSGEFETDANGFWSIPIEDLPDGLLTQYSGDFMLQVQDATCKPIKFKVAQEYDCILFNIKSGTYEKNTLGCNFSCVGQTGTKSQLIPFTEEEEIEIGWTGDLATLYGNSPVVQVYHLIYGNSYQLANVSIQQEYVDSVLVSITIINGGPATGYIVIA